MPSTFIPSACAFKRFLQRLPTIWRCKHYAALYRLLLAFTTSPMPGSSGERHCAVAASIVVPRTFCTDFCLYAFARAGAPVVHLYRLPASLLANGL